jgi:hypothetical protein
MLRHSSDSESGSEHKSGGDRSDRNDDNYLSHMRTSG